MNYQRELDIILNNIDINNKPKLLLHACCGPCSSYVIEYTRRLKELKKFISKFNSSVTVIEEKYDPNEFYKNIKGLEKLGERSERCYECYKLRLNNSAKYAKNNNFDYFTTTLSISPYKNAEWINKIGIELQKKYDVKYLVADFKKKNGYKRSLELSKEYKLYRQEYCGCVYSMQEREIKVYM